MKNLILPLLTLIVSVVSAQKIIKTEKVTDHSTHVIGNNFEGVIFSDKEISGFLFTKGNKKFTPTENDIIKAERLTTLSLDTIKDVTNQKVYIKRHLKKYLRQYFGYINENGERIISINFFFWNTSDNKSGKRWLNEAIDVSDGGNRYWQIKINLTTQESFDFYINGEA